MSMAYGGPPRCTVLGGTFAILVQLGLASSAIGTLVYKRAKERPRRPVRRRPAQLSTPTRPTPGG